MLPPKEESQGGYFIPQIAYRNVERKNFHSVRWIGSLVCKLGYGIAMIGINIGKLGYIKEEYHPYDDLINAIKELDNK